MDLGPIASVGVWAAVVYTVVNMAWCGPSQAGERWAPQVNANYKINVAGIDLGFFNFFSKMVEGNYALDGHAKFSFGFGAYKWKGSINSRGALLFDRAVPGSYKYNFRTKRKTGSVDVRFLKGNVKSVKLVPPRGPSPKIVPLKPAHLKGVFDPMSALIVLSRVQSGNPCQRRIGIFDGKQRFDLEFSYRRRERISEARPSGQPRFAYVCRVRYRPIAGYKNNRTTREMAGNSNMEVAMRPIPSAKLLLPYRVTIPSRIGRIQIYARRVTIVTPANRHIALVH